MDRLAKIEARCKNYIDDPTYVYKSCNNCIVILKKLVDTITNESREVADANYAQFRANKLLVVDIIDKSNINKKINSVKNTVYKKNIIKYKIGKIVCVDDFCQDLSIVCAPGIHYFKTIKRTFYYEFDDMYGYCYNWYDSGNPKSEGNYVFWRKAGHWKYWDDIGTIKSET